MTPDKKELPLHKKIVLKLMNAFNNHVQLSVMRWLAAGWFDLKQGAPVAVGTGASYVEGVDYITPLVLMAAQGARERARHADPAGYQAELNACMEAVRADGIKGPTMALFGSLIGQGCPPNEALVQLSANFVHLGMYLERRLALSFEGEPRENES